MQFIDSHLHLQDYKTNNAPQIIADLRAKGFVKIVCASSVPSDWEQVAALAARYPDMVIPAFGLHPWYIKDAPENWSDKIRGYLQKFSNAWVGECGLDRLKAPAEEGQAEAFAVQIELAKEFNRPLNIHVLKADDWLRPFWQAMPPRFMLHSFGGSIEFLGEALKYGAFISLSASVLKRKNSAEIIRRVPLNRLLLESDAPYLSDYGDIPALAAEIATIKNTGLAEVVNAVYHNFEGFCNEK